MPGTTASNRRVNLIREPKLSYSGYEDGSAVRNLDEPVIDIPRKRSRTERTGVSVRRKTAAISRGFVAFLAVCCLITTVLCVSYLQERSRLITLNDEIGILESQYTRIKGDNDAKYNQIISSFTMEDVKDAALNRLGMHYAGADQVQYYSLSQDSYVRQYKEVTQTE